MKAMEAINHITEAVLSDDPKKKVQELDAAAEMLDEMSMELSEEEGEEQDEGEAEEHEGEEQEEQGEQEVEGVRDRLESAVGAAKEKVPGPSPAALAGIGIVAGLAVLGAMKALKGGED
jgi:uncharacterized protein YhaN